MCFFFYRHVFHKSAWAVGLKLLKLLQTLKEAIHHLSNEVDKKELRTVATDSTCIYNYAFANLYLVALIVNLNYCLWYTDTLVSLLWERFAFEGEGP